MRETSVGTPQGGLISPILANVYLHYVLDLWFEKGIHICIEPSSSILRRECSVQTIYV